MNQSILLVSNGYGEDKVAAYLGISLMKKLPGITINAFPTVGKGHFYRSIGIETVYRGTILPSEGFVRSFKDFFGDILHGFINKTLKMGFKLKNISERYDYIITVGDPYILLFTSVFSSKKKEKKIFVGLQQSEWYQSRKPFKEHYSFIERIWMKLLAGIIFVRDLKTAEYLKSKGFSNVFSYGNPMMDCVEISKEKIFPSDKVVVGILPGSKKEAYRNLRLIFKIMENLSSKIQNTIFAIAIPPNLELQRIIEENNLKKVNSSKIDASVSSIYIYSKKGINSNIIISDTHFGDIINESKIIIGTSGTANEQAAGLGKPIFSFWGKGPQITKKFLKAQKRLLGKSLFVFDPEPKRIAKEILEVINDEKLLKEIEENGKQRMAGRGSIEKISERIVRYIST